MVKARLTGVDSTTAITRAQFARPHPDLRRYVTTYYVADVQSPDGKEIEDLIHPEWGSIRFLCDGSVKGGIYPAPLVEMPPTILVGPSSRASPIVCTSMRIVSFGLLPLGWHRLVGQSAHRYADASVEASDLPSTARFSALLPQLKSAQSFEEITTIFDASLLDALQSGRRINGDDETAIERVHQVLHDPDVSSVADMTSSLGITTLQLERLSKRVFGFPPKLLLRRQRFLRTLAMVLRQPRAKWSEILDPQYYDQAHFNRDFRRFFGMSPKQYLATPRPIVAVAARERMLALGDPLQGLQKPGG
jgi:AraC-like DNA-binding protein